MTIARQVVPERTYLISRRCTQRQMLLRPEPDVEQIYLYCLGEAVARYDVALNGFIAMSNHQHLVIRDRHGNFPEFLAHLHKMLAKAMNRLRGRWENFWATEQPNAVHLVDPVDRLRKLVYLLANPVKDHLVEHARDWPGACSLRLHYSGKSKTVRRPRLFFDPKGTMPAEVTLRIERPEGFEALTELEWIDKLERGIREVELDARIERSKTGKRVLGRKGVLRMDPAATPSHPAERGGLRPQLACRNGRRRSQALSDLLTFRKRRSDALRRYLAGEPHVVFPFGTFRVRGFFVATGDPSRCEPSSGPQPDASARLRPPRSVSSRLPPPTVERPPTMGAIS